MYVGVQSVKADFEVRQRKGAGEAGSMADSRSVKAYAKINLGLDVLRRRPDGYHELRMGMQTVSLCDEVLIRKKEAPGITLTCDREGLPTDGRNLAYRAAEAILKRAGRENSGVNIDLKKRIPAAAGLAGGSADAAAVLRGMNELFGFGYSPEELCETGLPLGADIPYCVMGGTMLAEGIGEKLTPLPDLPDCAIVIVKPEFDLSTGFIYTNLCVDTLDASLHPDMDIITEALRKGDLEMLSRNLGNILEVPAMKVHPELENVKRTLRRAGAAGVSMSGSGSAVFGIFTDREKADRCPAVFRETEGISGEVTIAFPVPSYFGTGGTDGR